jgi:hypothetical protein
MSFCARFATAFLILAQKNDWAVYPFLHALAELQTGGKEITMPFNRFATTTTRGAAAGLTLLAFLLSTGSVPVAAADRQNGQLHIVKDCGIKTNPANTCLIVNSNLDELPAGSLIFYDQPTGGPAVGNGILDSNIFVYVKSGDWAVGRCTLDYNTFVGVCTLSYGSGALATISARVNVTYRPGGDGSMFEWHGTYSFNRSGN